MTMISVSEVTTLAVSGIYGEVLEAAVVKGSVYDRRSAENVRRSCLHLIQDLSILADMTGATSDSPLYRDTAGRVFVFLAVFLSDMGYDVGDLTCEVIRGFKR